jgi:hypothetical protein
MTSTTARTPRRCSGCATRRRGRSPARGLGPTSRTLVGRYPQSSWRRCVDALAQDSHQVHDVVRVGLVAAAQLLRHFDDVAVVARLVLGARAQLGGGVVGELGLVDRVLAEALHRALEGARARRIGGRALLDRRADLVGEAQRLGAERAVRRETPSAGERFKNDAGSKFPGFGEDEACTGRTGGRGGSRGGYRLTCQEPVFDVYWLPNMSVTKI